MEQAGGGLPVHYVGPPFRAENTLFCSYWGCEKLSGFESLAKRLEELELEELES